MADIIWKEPSVKDVEFIQKIVCCDRTMGSDCSGVNIFLLRHKYDIKICFYKDFLLRKYNGREGRRGYGFPIGFPIGFPNGKGDIKETIKWLENDARHNGETMEFCLISEQQKCYLEENMPGKYSFSSYRGNSDYIYIQEDLAELRGRRFHKKKNHCSQFDRKYPLNHLELINDDNIGDAYKVAKKWYEEKAGDRDASKKFEMEEIREAVKYYNELGLTGGVLYVDREPVAMTMASGINNKVCDIHFEKAIGTYADNGAYAAINKKFAMEMSQYEYINREEDVGVEGLRKAKMSYHPYIVLDKYTARRN